MDKKTMEKLLTYSVRAEEMHARMLDLSREAITEDRAVDVEFFQLQADLYKLNRAYRAYCKRHNIIDAPHYCF